MEITCTSAAPGPIMGAAGYRPIAARLPGLLPRHHARLALGAPHRPWHRAQLVHRAAVGPAEPGGFDEHGTPSPETEDPRLGGRRRLRERSAGGGRRTARAAGRDHQPGWLAG